MGPKRSPQNPDFAGAEVRQDLTACTEHTQFTLFSIGRRLAADPAVQLRGVFRVGQKNQHAGRLLCDSFQC